jgi:hypothetical protein
MFVYPEAAESDEVAFRIIESLRTWVIPLRRASAFSADLPRHLENAQARSPSPVIALDILVRELAFGGLTFSSMNSTGKSRSSRLLFAWQNHPLCRPSKVGMTVDCIPQARMSCRRQRALEVLRKVTFINTLVVPTLGYSVWRNISSLAGVPSYVRHCARSLNRPSRIAFAGGEYGQWREEPLA